MEAYVLGSASEAETSKLLELKDKHPQIQEALRNLEIDMECIAEHMAITPPPGTWTKIETQLNELAKTSDFQNLSIGPPPESRNRNKRGDQFIEVDASSSHMRVHKIWRWLFIAVFILSKIFLGFAIYFYLENRQLKRQVSELQTELRKYKGQQNP
nr:hypothetical protein [Pedobacter cryoconitis]